MYIHKCYKSVWITFPWPLKVAHHFPRNQSQKKQPVGVSLSFISTKLVGLCFSNWPTLVQVGAFQDKKKTSWVLRAPTPPAARPGPLAAVSPSSASSWGLRWHHLDASRSHCVPPGQLEALSILPTGPTGRCARASRAAGSCCRRPRPLNAAWKPPFQAEPHPWGTRGRKPPKSRFGCAVTSRASLCSLQSIIVQWLPRPVPAPLCGKAPCDLAQTWSFPPSIFLPLHLFSTEKYVPMLRYSECLLRFAGWDALPDPKQLTEHSGHWHVNQCADLAGKTRPSFRLYSAPQDVGGLNQGGMPCMSMTETTSNSLWCLKPYREHS